MMPICTCLVYSEINAVSNQNNISNSLANFVLFCQMQLLQWHLCNSQYLNYEKLISRWNSEHKLFMMTPYTYYEIQKRALAWSKYIHKYFHIVSVPKATEFGEITWRLAITPFKGHSRSPILVLIESWYRTSYYWLIVTYLLSCTVSEI